MVIAALPQIREQSLCCGVAVAHLPFKIHFNDRIGVEPGKAGEIGDFCPRPFPVADVPNHADQGPNVAEGRTLRADLHGKSAAILATVDRFEKSTLELGLRQLSSSL